LKVRPSVVASAAAVKLDRLVDHEGKEIERKNSVSVVLGHRVVSISVE